MDFFTKEHIRAREAAGTSDQADYWLSSINTKCLNEDLSLYLHEDVTEFIQRMPYFFFATSSAKGNVNVNFKGAEGGRLIKVVNSGKIVFPDYKGNGILHSAGDIYSNPNVGILIIDFNKNIRLKISGRATIIDDKESIARYFDYFETYNIERLIEIDIHYAIPNCSNNIGVVKKHLFE